MVAFQFYCFRNPFFLFQISHSPFSPLSFFLSLTAYIFLTFCWSKGSFTRHPFEAAVKAADSCVVENWHVYNFLRFCTGTVRNVQLTASRLNEPLNTNTLYLNLCFEHYSFLLSLNNKISECHHTTSVYLLHSLNDKHTRSLYISHSLSPTYLHKHSSRNFSSFFPIFDFTSSPVWPVCYKTFLKEI